jgi:SOS-response transcriptional repressor LexA
MNENHKTLPQLLAEGQTVRFRPHGNSMVPLIMSGQLVTVSPVNSDITVGDIVLCKVEGRQMLHKVTAIGSDGRFQIGNNHGHINGWCTLKGIFGVLTAVED